MGYKNQNMSTEDGISCFSSFHDRNEDDAVDFVPRSQNYC